MLRLPETYFLKVLFNVGEEICAVWIAADAFSCYLYYRVRGAFKRFCSSLDQTEQFFTIICQYKVQSLLTPLHLLRM